MTKPNHTKGRITNGRNGLKSNVEVHETAVIYEAKDGRYGEDGSEMYP